MTRFWLPLLLTRGRPPGPPPRRPSTRDAASVLFDLSLSGSAPFSVPEPPTARSSPPGPGPGAEDCGSGFLGYALGNDLAPSLACAGSLILQNSASPGLHSRSPCSPHHEVGEGPGTGAPWEPARAPRLLGDSGAGLWGPPVASACERHLPPGPACPPGTRAPFAIKFVWPPVPSHSHS